MIFIIDKNEMPSHGHAETLHLALQAAKFGKISGGSDVHSMSRHIDRLIDLYEKESLKTLTLRETVRKLRQEKALKERQVQLANRTIERLAVDRGTTEAQDATKDACIRRLQTQVAVLGKKGDLNQTAEEMSCEMAERVVRLELEVGSCKAERDAFEKRVRDLEEENRKLARAVQVSSEVKLAATGAVEEREALHKANNDKLLLAVAKAQEEAIGLAKELAVAKNDTETMEAALKKARDHLQKQHEALQRWKEYESSHAKKERSLVEEIETLKVTMGEMKGEQRERRALEERVRELVGRLEVEKTQRLEAEARLKIIEGEGSRQNECSAMHPVISPNEGKKESTNTIDLQVTLGNGPHQLPGQSRPTLFDIATMDDY